MSQLKLNECAFNRSKKWRNNKSACNYTTMENSVNSVYYPSGKYSIQEGDTSVGDERAENSFYYPWEMTRLSPGKSSAFGAVFIVVNAALGAGLLSFPLAFYSAGGYIQGIAIELVS